jgi:hypothetical protein
MFIEIIFAHFPRVHFQFMTVSTLAQHPAARLSKHRMECSAPLISAIELKWNSGGSAATSTSTHSLSYTLRSLSIAVGWVEIDREAQAGRKQVDSVLPFTVIGWAGGRASATLRSCRCARREHPQQQVADPDLAIATDDSPYLHPGRAVQLALQCKYIIAAWMDAVPAAAVPPMALSAMPRLRDERICIRHCSSGIGGCTQVDALLSMCLYGVQIVTHLIGVDNSYFTVFIYNKVVCTQSNSVKI